MCLSPGCCATSEGGGVLVQPIDGFPYPARFSVLVRSVLLFLPPSALRSFLLECVGWRSARGSPPEPLPCVPDVRVRE